MEKEPIAVAAPASSSDDTLASDEIMESKHIENDATVPAVVSSGAVSVSRKPISSNPHSNVANIAPTHMEASEKDAMSGPLRPSEDLTAMPQSQPYESLPPPVLAPKPRKQGRFVNIKRRWSSLKLWMRIAIIAAVVCVLALIIGLAAGLSTRDKNSNLPLPTNHGGPYTGDLTYYQPGLGACGITSSSSDSIVAVSHILFDAASKSSDPNSNPLCGTKIRISRNGQSRDVTVVDRCVSCKETDLDTSITIFGDLAEVAQGRVTAQWAWLENVNVNA